MQYYLPIPIFSLHLLIIFLISDLWYDILLSTVQYDRIAPKRRGIPWPRRKISYQGPNSGGNPFLSYIKSIIQMYDYVGSAPVNCPFVLCMYIRV